MNNLSQIKLILRNSFDNNLSKSLIISDSFTKSKYLLAEISKFLKSNDLVFIANLDSIILDNGSSIQIICYHDDKSFDNLCGVRGNFVYHKDCFVFGKDFVNHNVIPLITTNVNPKEYERDDKLIHLGVLTRGRVVNAIYNLNDYTD